MSTLPRALTRLLLLPALLLPVLATGCHGDIIDPKIEIPEKRTVVVVPFRDEDFANGWESPRGCELASRVAKIFREKKEFKVTSMEKVLDLYNAGDPRVLTAKEVAEKTGADYVLMGDVVHWATQDENMYSPVYRGTSTIEVSVYETAAAALEREGDKAEISPGRGRLAVARNACTALFPQEYGMHDVGSTTMTREQVEKGLLGASATSVSWVLLAHTKDEEKLSSGK